MDEVARLETEVDGNRLSYLHAGSGRPLLLLHGTFWSRVWEPILGDLAAAGQEVFALDFPGFGASAGRLTREQATVPALAACAERFLEAVGVVAPVAVAGHDIGGAVAQNLAARGTSVDRLVLMNSVLYDSWPVPAVERFRDPAVAEAVTGGELLDARAQSLAKAISRPLEDAERRAWLAPWRDENRVRSWIAMAAAADARYTLELMDDLRERALPTLLVWGDQDEFQPLAYAERYAGDVPGAELVRVPGARHIPTVEEPAFVGETISRFMTALRS
ncbi:MAG: alpha/beta hydrolase [Thermoleophilaceae bacterium]